MLPFFIFLLCSWHTVSGEQIDPGVLEEEPSIRVRITKSGFDYANKLAGKYLELSIVNRDTPTFKTDMGTGGAAELTLSNIVVSRFETPDLKYELVPPHNIRWYCEGGHAIVSADFRLVTNQFIRTDGSGDIRANISGLHFSTDIALAMNEHGKPQIYLTNVESSIADMDIKFGGGMMAWLLAKFKNTIATQVSTMVAQTVAQKVKQAGERFANSKLEQIVMMVPVGRNFFLDYHMVRNMTVTPDYVDFSHRGEVKYHGAIREIPHGPPGLPARDRSDHMIMVWVSQYAVNSWLHLAHKGSLFQMLLNGQTVPQMARQLRTTCTYRERCIGVAIENLERYAPNNTVQVYLKSAEPPEFTIIQGMEGPKIIGNLSGVTFSYVNESRFEFFTFNLIFKAYMEVWVERARMHGKLRIHILEIDDIESNVGRINALDLTFLESAISTRIERLANGMIQDGVAIPALSMLRYEYPGIEMDRESILVYSDLYYRPI